MKKVFLLTLLVLFGTFEVKAAFKKNEKTEFTSIQTYKLLTIKLLYSMIL